MKRMKWIVVFLAIIVALFAIVAALSSRHALLIHPKGWIAHEELRLITINILLMLILVIPTYILLFAFARKYRAQNTKAKYEPERTVGFFREWILWLIPTSLIAVMAVITWNAAHRLDPYRPIENKNEPLTIQVVALDWKWLFIYPEFGIATVNFVAFPYQTPIHFELSADGSPMNSFWIPELSGQIYAMSGMSTSLYLMADGPGEYPGRAAEINGEGFADMTFTAKSMDLSSFDNWVSEMQQSSLILDAAAYEKLVKPSSKYPVTFYSSVEDGLFHKIVMKTSHLHEK